MVLYAYLLILSNFLINTRMPMRTYTPKIIQEVQSTETGFTDGKGLLDRPFNVNSIMPVYGVATSRGGLVTSGSRSLVFRDFGITNPGTVTGIELELEITRLARVQDKTIQLWVNGSAQGRNLADLSAPDVKVYGSSTELWGVPGVNVTDPGFGFLIDLQPHTQYPSNNTVYLRKLILRLHTA